MMLPDPDAVLAAAHDYTKLGWRVIPIHGVDAEGLCTCGAGAHRSAGKHPVDAGWQNSPALSGADVQATWEGTPYNIGIATGEPSGFWVLDLDFDKPGARDAWNAFVAEHGSPLTPTYMVRTGGGGYQAYYQMPDFNVSNAAGRLPNGVDVRGTGGQVVAPPSVSSKGPYSVAHDLPVAPAPAWLLEFIRPKPPAPPVDLDALPKLDDLSAEERRRLASYTDRALDGEYARLAECSAAGWSGPGWNDTVFQVACTLLEFAQSPWCPLTGAEAWTELARRAPRDGGFGTEEIKKCWDSAAAKTDGQARPYPPGRPAMTVYPGDPLSDPTADSGDPATPAAGHVVRRPNSDLGNAQRMVDIYGETLRWVKEAKTWAIYDAGRWEIAGDQAARSLVQDMVEGLVEREGHLYDDMPSGDDPDKPGPSERDGFLKWARGQQATARISSCQQETSGRKVVQTDMTMFDKDPFLFNVSNGVVNLQTGELLPHDPAQLLMLQSPVHYDADAQAPRWEAFLQRCLPDPAVRTYVQKMFGYSLTGSMAEQSMFIHHGPGANGKSVFLVVASHIAGTYGQVVPRETLLAKTGSGTEHPTSVARMRGRRFLQASETAAGRRLDEETVKGLTGGEQQTARFMGADFFDFTPTGKIHFVTNHLPRLTDAESIWRRLHLIAWRETIPVAERDAQLAQRIIDEEAAGVLAWAVAGAVSWSPGDLLVEPESMVVDKDGYRADQDILGEFLAQRIERDPVAFAPMSEIYGAYSAWCFNTGQKAMTSPSLSKILRERHYEEKRTKVARGFHVRILPVDQHDPLLTR